MSVTPRARGAELGALGLRMPQVRASKKLSVAPTAPDAGYGAGRAPRIAWQSQVLVRWLLSEFSLGASRRRGLQLVQTR